MGHIMKLKYEMTTIEIDDSIMAVPVDCDEKFNGIIRMNETTAEILELLKSDMTEEQIVNELLSKYDAPRETIQGSVKRVVDTLRANNLLV